jgi:hypothetical protein
MKLLYDSNALRPVYFGSETGFVTFETHSYNLNQMMSCDPSFQPKIPTRTIPVRPSKYHFVNCRIIP